MVLFCRLYVPLYFGLSSPGEKSDTGPDQVIEIGPLVLSVNHLIISVFATLTVVPINAIIVAFFKYSKKKNHIDVERIRLENMKLAAKTSDKVRNV